MNNQATILTLTIILSSVTFSCADQKISQCQQIIAVTQKIAQETEAKRNTKDIQQILPVADTFEEVAMEMEKLEITDPQLQEYQAGFAQFYRDNAQATREFITALQQKDVTIAKAAKHRLEKIGNTEKKLVQGVETYCRTN